MLSPGDHCVLAHLAHQGPFYPDCSAGSVKSSGCSELLQIRNYGGFMELWGLGGGLQYSRIFVAFPRSAL